MTSQRIKERELLKEKRAKLLSEIIDKIKLSIEKNKVKGENASKIFIYSRLIIQFYTIIFIMQKYIRKIYPLLYF